MMKKLRIENLWQVVSWLRLLLATILVRPVAAGIKWMKRKMLPPVKIRVTRHDIVVALRERAGWKVHLLARPGVASVRSRTFELVAIPAAPAGANYADSGPQYQLVTRPEDITLATYASESEAALALATLNKALTGSFVWKWVFRLVLAWLAWLFVTSYMEVSRQSAANAATPDALGLAAPTPGALPTIPSGPAAFQSIPSVTGPDGGDLSNYIFQQAKAAQQKAQKDALPPKAGVDDAAGLEAFGLKGATNSNGSGEGCDPKLAFKVPQQ